MRLLKPFSGCGLIVFCALSGQLAVASGITTSVFCQNPTSTFTGGAQCQQGETNRLALDPFVSASSSASAGFNGVSGYASISLSATAYSNFNSANNNEVDSESVATANINLTLNTPGPVRPGLLVLSFSSWNLATDIYGSTISETLQIGPFHQSCFLVGFSGPNCLQQEPIFEPWSPATQIALPIELGDSYTLNFTATDTAGAYDFYTPTGIFTGNLTFALVDSVPEPSSWGLVGCPFLLFALRRFTKRSASPTRASMK
ncbi:MAG TPA: hypothetical protein VFA65_22595 [Bryobacteraceae bacterium]|nr:hypothetical protein [Bryobacteraceae bacterium]